MQNVVHSSACDSVREGQTDEASKVHSGSSSPLSGNLSTERGQSVTSLPSNFMADLSESDDDEVSEVESFILDQGDLDEEPVLDTSKFLLSTEGTDSPDFRNVDPETQARLEALLEATGIGKLSLSDGKQFADPEVLRRLTSSVSCALDEAAAALTRMRAEHVPATGQGDSGNNDRSLAEACSDGDIGTVRRLLDEGRNVNEITEEGESLLSLACSSGYYELAQLLLAMRANVEDRGLKDTTPLMEAASAGHMEIVKLLIAHGADVNAQTSQGNTPLMFACVGGHEDVVRILLEAGSNVEDHNENGHTPLMEAASSGHVGVAKILVQHGASINTHSNEFKESALTLACYKGHLEMVRFLLEAGADQEHKTDEMHTALMEASMDGHVEVARLLLDSGAQVNMPADSFESPLTLAACGGHVELAMLLLERGANIEEVNDEGYTPLMEAAREGHEEMVALLLSQGADINAQTEETQETALTLACCGGFLEVADFLIKAGADFEIGASTPLMEAAQEGHLDLVRYLIGAGANVNAQTATGDTALTYACENGHTDVADLLLQAGAELEHESEGGRTPLMKAARAGHLCTVQFLISKGASVNKQTTNNDHTPLSLACAGGHLAVVELLLAHGSDPAHKLKDNSTMLIEAAKGGHTAVVQLLLDYPNNLLASPPPPPPDLAQLASSSLEASEAPRVPPHGLQVISPQESDHSIAGLSYFSNVQTVPRLPDPLHTRDALPCGSQQPAAKSNMQKSLQRKNTLTKGGDAPSSTAGDCHGQQRIHQKSKSSSSAQTISLNAQSDVNNQRGLQLDSTSGNLGASVSLVNTTGGGGNDSFDEKDLKPSERLEACINSMMKKAEMLHPSPEEQILQKQQILEELQRVERELQEKAQAQLLLSAQQQQHHHSLQSLACATTATTSLGTIPGAATLQAQTAAHGQQLLLNSAAILDMGPLSSSVLPDLSGVTGHLGLTLKTATTAHLGTSAVPIQAVQPQLYQAAQQLQAGLPSASSTCTTSNMLAALDYSKGRTSKQVTKQVKSTSLKQQQQLHPNSFSQPQAGKSQVQVLSDEVEKMNLRNVGMLEQAHHHQILHQQAQHQFVLSEFAQNLTLRANGHLSEGTADALALMQAAGSIKFTTDGTQTHAIPIIDPVAVSQALALQQQQLQQQQLQQQQQLVQTLQLETKRQQHPDKSIKLQKGKNLKVQQLQQPTPQQQIVQIQQPQVPSKSQLATTTSDACTLVSNIPFDATGVLTLGGVGTPAFPVSLAMSPGTLASPVTIATTCGTTFTHNISLEDGLMVATPARTLNETLGEIMTGPTTQLAGTQVAITQQTSATTHCIEPCLATATSGASMGVGFTMTSLPSGSAPSPSLPLTFHALAPSVTSAVPAVGTVAAASAAVVTAHHHSQLAHTAVPPFTPVSPSTSPSIAIDLNSQTDSNHDTALTLACAGGHEDLVSLLLSRNADIEHRDKKGFTPLMLAATAGHSGVVEILLNHRADIEAQSERTKDTALSLACSGGRYEVVEILLAHGANKEHRNVSDYTPLSLAASGGYVNIIKLLLNHGAEINSRTGSKLGISPLMLAAMNGHTAAVKLLLDMGSDINAQIETNRNTALTLACFQGRHEVVSLLLDRKANVEHRAKTGLTPLMEAASGGYVEVGRVLLDKGADVNAPPVPSSRDTALTIAADKGHYRFVELLLSRGAAVDVKNKKGNSPLWLAANGGHLDVVQLLVNSGADIDSQDNRKVSCLMAAFRKGHVKVVKWMVKHVSQFPSDQEMTRYIATISDKELMKKCHQCMEIIRAAKERQAAEANKYATILLEELDLERSREESRRAAAARRRERKRRKKKEKQEQIRLAKAAAELNKKNECKIGDKCLQFDHQKNPGSQSDGDDDDDEDEDDDEEYDDDDDKEELDMLGPITVSGSLLDIGTKVSICGSSKITPEITIIPLPCGTTEIPVSKPKVNREIEIKPGCIGLIGEVQIFPRGNPEISRPEKGREKENKKCHDKERKRKSESRSAKEMRLAKEAKEKLAEKSILRSTEALENALLGNHTTTKHSRKKNIKQEHPVVSSATATNTTVTLTSTTVKAGVNSCTLSGILTIPTETRQSLHRPHKDSRKEVMLNGMISCGPGDLDNFTTVQSSTSSKGSKLGKSVGLDSKGSGLDALGELALELPNDLSLSTGLRSPTISNFTPGLKSPLTNSTSPKKGQKREDGWKEVVRRSKKVSVPSNAISRVIGRGGCNINAIREVSAAHIEVEKQKGQGDRTIIIRGSAEATRQAHQLITALIKEPDRELSEILIRCGLSRINTVANPSGSSTDSLRLSLSSGNNPSVSFANQVLGCPAFVLANQTKSRQAGGPKMLGNAVSAANKVVSIPPPSLPANAAPPFTNQPRPTATGTLGGHPGISVNAVGAPPFPSNSHSAWAGAVITGKAPAILSSRSSSADCTTTSSTVSTVSSIGFPSSPAGERSPVVRQLFPLEKQVTTAQQGTSTITKTTVSYTMAVISQGKSTKTVPATSVTVVTTVSSATDTKPTSIVGNHSSRSNISQALGMVVPNSLFTAGQNNGTALPGVQPFPSAQPQHTMVTNSSMASQNPKPPSPQPSQAKPSSTLHLAHTVEPFVSATSSVSYTPATSSQAITTLGGDSSSPTANSGQSSISNEFSPFNNIFSKVAQPSVWGQKDKETTKPNFASVAASGVTSVASHTQNSTPVRSSLSLSLPHNSEHDLLVDAAKAPGYRGNLHVSPNTSASGSSALSSSAPHPAPATSAFGPIGSGPRSAPCTPPLGPIGHPSMVGNSLHRASSPTIPGSPPLHSRSLPDSHGFPLDLQSAGAVNGSMGTTVSAVGAGPHNLGSGQTVEGLFHHHQQQHHHPHHQQHSQPHHGHHQQQQQQQQQHHQQSQHHHHHHQSLQALSSRLSNFPLSASSGVNTSSRFLGPVSTHTNTTFSQHGSLSSVGSIMPEAGSSSSGNSNAGLPVIQSTLNPNAPDFSSRSSLLLTQHGPPLQPRMPSNSNPFPDATAQSLAAFRPVMASAGSMNPAFASLHGLPGPPPQGLGRFPFPPNHNQQQPGDFSQPQTLGPVGTLPPGMTAPGLAQNAEALRILSGMAGYPNPSHPAHGVHHIPSGSGSGMTQHFAGLSSVVGMRPNQRSSNTTPSVGASSKDGSPVAVVSPTVSPQGSNLSSPTGMGMAGGDRHVNAIGEDRKLPRPIGTERAQKKNPVFGGAVSDIWSFNTPGDWMPTVPSGMHATSPLSQEDSLPPLLSNNYGSNRFSDSMGGSEPNHHMENTYQHNSLVASASGGYPQFLNGLPPQMLAAHLYSANSGGPSNLGLGNPEIGGELWGKLPLPSIGDGLPPPPEHKMTWHNWSQHQA